MNARGSQPVQNLSIPLIHDSNHGKADAKDLTAGEREAEGVEAGIVNMELGGPTEEVIVGDWPYPEEMRGSGFAGCSPANPEDFHCKITDDEGREYAVRCGCRRCRIVPKG